MSNLACLFDLNCVSQLTRAAFPNLEALPTVPSRFDRNTSIGLLVDNLMIERWDHYSNYSAYTRACAPIDCEYFVMENLSVLSKITFLLGVYGGLTISMKFLAWYGFVGLDWIVDRLRYRTNNN